MEEKKVFKTVEWLIAPGISPRGRNSRGGILVAGAFARHEFIIHKSETICQTLFQSLCGNKIQSANEQDKWIKG